MSNTSDSVVSSWYLTLLGQLVFLPEGELYRIWDALPEERRNVFLHLAWKDNVGMFCLSRLEQRLGKAYYAKAAEERIRMRALAALREKGLQDLYAFLEANSIRFAPLKGADLAYRVYPAPYVRVFNDFDFLFHPRDLDKAQDLLIRAGWKPMGHVDKSLHHHLEPLLKGKALLEPHWNLPQCEGADPEKIWSYLLPVNASRYSLTPELHILTLARHASEMQYRETSLSRFLLDCSMVLQHDGCDWNSLRRLAQELQQPYPGNLLAAFPEFFPPQMLEKMGQDQEKSALYREIFAERSAFTAMGSSEITVLQGGICTGTWWRRRFNMLHPVFIRDKYHLPAKGAIAQLAWAYLKDISHKAWDFLHYSLASNRQRRAFLKLIDKAEKH